MSSMKAQPPLHEIELLPAAAAADGELVEEITDLVNRVYEKAEKGLWVDAATRTNTTEVAELIAGGQIAVAWQDKQVMGSVRIQQLDSGEGEFGMLVADRARRGEGIGRELVIFAEELSRQRGLTVMQLELLVPREWKHPTKEFLHGWYTRIGYRPVRSDTIDQRYPQLAPLLATPCDFVVYHKDLQP
jgi:GNAT superfamily N-acetyltransferase